MTLVCKLGLYPYVFETKYVGVDDIFCQPGWLISAETNLECGAREVFEGAAWVITTLPAKLRISDQCTHTGRLPGG